MAITQISKIQIRRDKKEAGTGLPQLSSGEMAWCFDTQELYIGNGSVTEGAPAVGNTKILTEHNNILDIAIKYKYRLIGTVERSIQARLDDHVSVKAFGDDIQTAIDQLYLSNRDSTDTWKVTLELEAGKYPIYDPIKLPSYTHLKGQGIDKTTIIQNDHFAVAYTVNDTSTVGHYADISTTNNNNQPKYIVIEDLTLETTSDMGCLILDASRNCLFRNVKFKGIWESGTLINGDIGVELIAKSNLVTCQNNIFENCSFENFSYGIDSQTDIRDNAINNSTFSVLGKGIHGTDSVTTTSGNEIGTQNTKITNNIFNNISEEAIKVNFGTGNLTQNNTYQSVGNHGLSSLTASTNVVYFGQAGNVSDNDYFERSIDLSSDVDYQSIAYIGEYGGKVNGNHKYNPELTIVHQATPTTLFRLGGDITGYYVVHYMYQSTVADVVRRGYLRIIIDDTSVSITDEFDTKGNELNAENLQFSALLTDLNSDTILDTIEIQYTNSTASDDGIFSYWYEIAT